MGYRSNFRKINGTEFLVHGPNDAYQIDGYSRVYFLFGLWSKKILFTV